MSVSVLLRLRRKCIHWPHCVLPPGESRWVPAARSINVRIKDVADGQTDRRTDWCQTVTLRLPLDAASVINLITEWQRFSILCYYYLPNDSANIFTVVTWPTQAGGAYTVTWQMGNSEVRWTVGQHAASSVEPRIYNMVVTDRHPWMIEQLWGAGASIDWLF